MSTPIPFDDRVVYVVAANAYDFSVATAVLRERQAVFIRTADLSTEALFEAMTSTNAVVWLFGLWTRGVVPADLETFGGFVNAAKNRGVLVDTF